MNRLRRPLLWTVWLGAALAGAAGLRYYTVDNNIEAWVPHCAAVGEFGSYLVIGFDRSRCDPARLAQRLRALPGVAFCIDPESVRGTGWVVGVTGDHFVEGPDGRYVGIFVFRTSRISDEALVQRVQACLSNQHPAGAADFAVAGPAVFHVALNEISQRRMTEAMLAILIVGGLMTRWITGRWSAAATGVVALVLSQIILVGLASWLRMPMDMSLSMVPPLMMSLAFSYAAHQALRGHSGKTLLLCYLTTALGIGSFVWTDVVPIRRFAVFGVIGLGLTWLAVISLVPGPTGSNDPGAHRAPLLRAALKCSLAAVSRWRRAVLAVTGELAVASVFACPFLRFENNPLNYFPPKSRFVQDFSLLNDRLTGMLPFQVCVDGEADPAPMLRDTPGVHKVIDTSRFLRGGSKTYWCLADNSALPSLIAAHQRWQAWAGGMGVRLEWRGVAAQLAEVQVLIRRVAIGSLPFMALVAGLVVVIAHRSLRLGLYSVIVNLLPVLFLILLAALFRWPLDLPSLMIGSILIGVAVDDTLHLLASRRSRSSMSESLVECWVPCVGSSLVVAVCMAMFLLSPFRPTAQFGFLMSIGMLLALLSDMYVLPALVGGPAERRGSPGRTTPRLPRP